MASEFSVYGRDISHSAEPRWQQLYIYRAFCIRYFRCWVVELSSFYNGVVDGGRYFQFHFYAVCILKVTAENIADQSYLFMWTRVC